MRLPLTLKENGWLPRPLADWLLQEPELVRSRKRTVLPADQPSRVSLESSEVDPVELSLGVASEPARL